MLYRPFFCAHTPLQPYHENISCKNRISRLSDISATQFAQNWTNKPFILTEPARCWPISRNWSSAFKTCENIEFRAEAVDWPLHTYLKYLNDTHDESPMYLFDHSFVEKMGIHVGKDGQYWAPACFGDDLFDALGSQRPDSRWLVIGPERSGSTFHKDPNATRSAKHNHL